MRELNSEMMSICGSILGDFWELLERSSLPKALALKKYCMGVTAEVDNQRNCSLMSLDQMAGFAFAKFL